MLKAIIDWEICEKSGCKHRKPWRHSGVLVRHGWFCDADPKLTAWIEPGCEVRKACIYSAEHAVSQTC